MSTRKKRGKPGKPGSSRPIRTKRTVTINGQEYSVAEAARMTGISRHAMYWRLFAADWTDEEATGSQERPPEKQQGRTQLFLTIKTPDGSVRKSAKEWADAMPGNPRTNLNRICTRKHRNWTDAQALDIDPPPSKTLKPVPAKTRMTRTKPVKGTTDEQD